jgi:hypothetical protein
LLHTGLNSNLTGKVPKEDFMLNKQKHVRLVSIILYILGAFYLAGAAFFTIVGLWATKNYIQADQAETALVPAILTGAAFLIPLVLFGLFHIITGRAFQKQVNWARIALWILAILNLGNVPLGTAFGAYAIWVLVNTREDVQQIR